MPPLREQDLSLLENLRSEGFLTEDQFRRVRTLAESGQDLIASIKVAPLVEPLQILRAQQAAMAKLRSALPATPARTDASADDNAVVAVPMSTPGDAYAKTPVEPVKVVELRQGKDEETRQENLSVSEDLDFDLELEAPTPLPGPRGNGAKKPSVREVDDDDRPMDAPTVQMRSPFAAASAKKDAKEPSWDEDLEMEFMDISKDQDESGEQRLSEVTAAVKRPGVESRPATEGIEPPPSLALPADSTGYRKPGAAPPQFNLSDDEGITLIRSVNERIQHMIDEKNGALWLGLKGDQVVLAEYNTRGKHQSHETLDPEFGAKMANRLKIMARIQPWRQAGGQGCFHALHQGLDYTCLVEALEQGGLETIFVTLRPGKV